MEKNIVVKDLFFFSQKYNCKRQQTCIDISLKETHLMSDTKTCPVNSASSSNSNRSKGHLIQNVRNRMISTRKTKSNEGNPEEHIEKQRLGIELPAKPNQQDLGAASVSPFVYGISRTANITPVVLDFGTEHCCGKSSLSCNDR